MAASYEFLDDCVRVEVSKKVLNKEIGVSSYVISYTEFKKLLEEHSDRQPKQNDLEVLKVFMEKNKVDVPEHTIEAYNKEEGNIVLVQFIGKNNFTLLHVRGTMVDTSRYVVNIELTTELKVVNVEVHTFTGMMYGFHNDHDLQQNKFLTRKLSGELLGKTLKGLSEIQTEKWLRNITEEDINRSSDGSFIREVDYAKVHGKGIRWEMVKC